jgi:hypothetical protein
MKVCPLVTRQASSFPADCDSIDEMRDSAYFSEASLRGSLAAIDSTVPMLPVMSQSAFASFSETSGAAIDTVAQHTMALKDTTMQEAHTIAPQAWPSQVGNMSGCRLTDDGTSRDNALTEQAQEPPKHFVQDLQGEYHGIATATSSNRQSATPSFSAYGTPHTPANAKTPGQDTTHDSPIGQSWAASAMPPQKFSSEFQEARQEHKDNYVCTYCDNFSHVQSWHCARHELVHHDARFVYQCQDCEKGPWSTLRGLKRHHRTHKDCLVKFCSYQPVRSPRGFKLAAACGACDDGVLIDLSRDWSPKVIGTTPGEQHEQLIKQRSEFLHERYQKHVNETHRKNPEAWTQAQKQNWKTMHWLRANIANAFLRHVDLWPLWDAKIPGQDPKCVLWDLLEDFEWDDLLESFEFHALARGNAAAAVDKAHKYYNIQFDRMLHSMDNQIPQPTPQTSVVSTLPPQLSNISPRHPQAVKNRDHEASNEQQLLAVPLQADGQSVYRVHSVTRSTSVVSGHDTKLPPRTSSLESPHRHTPQATYEHTSLIGQPTHEMYYPSYGDTDDRIFGPYVTSTDQHRGQDSNAHSTHHYHEVPFDPPPLADVRSNASIPNFIAAQRGNPAGGPPHAATYALSTNIQPTALIVQQSQFDDWDQGTSGHNSFVRRMLSFRTAGNHQ